jgi:2-keto-4-pentenoate hydratase
MLSNVDLVAAALRGARRSGNQIAPIASTYDLKSIDEAYAAAAVNTRARLAEGRRVTGRKIGLTAESVQRQLGVDQPDFGVLFDDMELLDRGTVPIERFMQPKIEAEVAFVVGRNLRMAETPSWGQFVSAIAYALPALEIVDSAISDWRIGILDTVADNASAGSYVLGDQPVALGAFQLASVEAVVTRNGTVVSQGRGSACFGHPLRAAYWLVCEMARRGEGMGEGEIILSGALGPTAPVKSGDLIEADFGGFGRVACRFA